MRFFRMDDRGAKAILADTQALRQAIGVDGTPHFTALHKAVRWLLRFAGNCIMTRFR